MDFGVPADHKVKPTESENKDKYQDLAREPEKLLNMKVTVMPIIIGVCDTVTKGLIKGLEDLKIRGRVESIQTATLVRSARILRRVLDIELTFCPSNSCGELSAYAGVKTYQMSKMIIHYQTSGNERKNKKSILQTNDKTNHPTKCSKPPTVQWREKQGHKVLNPASSGRDNSDSNNPSKSKSLSRKPWKTGKGNWQREEKLWGENPERYLPGRCSFIITIAMIPLNYTLRKCTGGYNFTKSQEKINHLIYVDDSILFAKNEKNLLSCCVSSTFTFTFLLMALIYVAIKRKFSFFLKVSIVLFTPALSRLQFSSLSLELSVQLFFYPLSFSRF